MRTRDRRTGFSLIELLVVMTIFSIIIIAASTTFVGLLSESKRQGKITATNIEGMLGLEVMRRDIAHAGFGIYWGLDPQSKPTGTPAYTEISSGADPNGFALNDAPGGIPRPFVFGSGRGLNGSDRIAVKSVNASLSTLGEHWNYLYASPTIATNVWTSSTENIGGNEYIIVLRPDQSTRNLLFTKDASKSFTSQFKDVATLYNTDVTSIVFSLGTTTAPRMPFNRADFYIANTGKPTRCAAGTGVLYKAVADQSSGGTGFSSVVSLLDCVADMQVGYRFASDNGAYANTIADVTSDQPADDRSARQIREVRVYILAQEGQVDRTYSYPNQIVRVGEAGLYGRDFDLGANITGWQNYRWKLYTLVVEPLCLMPL